MRGYRAKGPKGPLLDLKSRGGPFPFVYTADRDGRPYRRGDYTRAKAVQGLPPMPYKASIHNG